MAKRKKKSSKISSKFLNYVAWFLAFVAFVMAILFTGYYFGYEDAKSDLVKKEKYQKQKRLTMLKKIEDYSKPKENNINDRLKEVLKKESRKENIYSVKKTTPTKKKIDASHEYDSIATLKPLKRPQKDVKLTSSKPKLAIIIDDVSVRSHVNAIKSIGLPITMSFLPPSSFRPNSAKLASKEKFYMVHLPMEAKRFTREEPLTLKTKDSQDKILHRIKELKTLFPKVKYINNHTGSKFTSNETAVNRLIFVLNSQNINFIDSRTTAKTKVPKVMKNFGLKYMARDVFLDHKMEKSYIKSQIKKAINIAKAHGTAIAIGHPHANTILALSESKKLFKDVDLVYVNNLY